MTNELNHHLIVNLSMLFQQPTGIANYANNLLPQLRSLNPTLLVATDRNGYNCHPIPNNMTPAQGSRGHLHRLLWTQLQLPKIYDQLKSSLLFSPVPEAPIGSRCRFVVMFHDLIPLRFPRFSPLVPYFRYYVPLVLQQAQQIICNSKATANDIIEFYGIDYDKISPIPLACDRAHFRPLALPQSPVPYFLYIGRSDPHKNLHRAIAALAQSGLKEYQLWIVGSKDRRYTPRLQQQAQTLGIAERVQFLNYVPYQQLPQTINQAAALVYPSLWEGFGLPVLEAMACGTPVIASNLASLPEVTGDAAILVNPYSVSELAWAMRQIDDSKERSRLSRLAQERSSHFSWQKTGQATRMILQQYL